MISFFTILAVLLIINGLLLLFSGDGFKKTFRKISDNTVIELPPAEFSDTKYKKAV